MSIARGPRIAKDGLVLCLDAADKNSYPGSGTSFYDISGIDNNGTNVNSPTFSTSNGGEFSYNGSNQYVRVPYTASLNPSSAITMESVAYRSTWNTALNMRLMSKTEGGGYQLSLNEGSSLVPSGNTGVIVYLSGIGYRSTYTALSGVSNGYHHFVGTFDGRYIKFYIDGVLKSTYDYGSSASIGYHVTYYANSLIIAAEASGGANAAGQYFDGSIAVSRLYNTALSQAQIQNNFNAVRKRYGI
jgi:hypothetical protein